MQDKTFNIKDFKHMSVLWIFNIWDMNWTLNEDVVSMYTFLLSEHWHDFLGLLLEM